MDLQSVEEAMNDIYIGFRERVVVGKISPPSSLPSSFDMQLLLYYTFACVD